MQKYLIEQNGVDEEEKVCETQKRWKHKSVVDEHLDNTENDRNCWTIGALIERHHWKHRAQLTENNADVNVDHLKGIN